MKSCDLRRHRFRKPLLYPAELRDRNSAARSTPERGPAHLPLSPCIDLGNTASRSREPLPLVPMPPSVNVLLASTAALVFLSTTWSSLAAAEDAGTPQPAPKEQRAPFDGSIWTFGDYDKACREWTDGCRGCRRIDSTTIDCSNIGIACQPKSIQCSSPAAAPPK
jgi:hypothetical protein